MGFCGTARRIQAAAKPSVAARAADDARPAAPARCAIRRTGALLLFSPRSVATQIGTQNGSSYATTRHRRVVAQYIHRVVADRAGDTLFACGLGDGGHADGALNVTYPHIPVPQAQLGQRPPPTAGSPVQVSKSDPKRTPMRELAEESLTFFLGVAWWDEVYTFQLPCACVDSAIHSYAHIALYSGSSS